MRKVCLLITKRLKQENKSQIGDLYYIYIYINLKMNNKVQFAVVTDNSLYS